MQITCLLPERRDFTVQMAQSLPQRTGFALFFIVASNKNDTLSAYVAVLPVLSSARAVLFFIGKKYGCEQPVLFDLHSVSRHALQHGQGAGNGATQLASVANHVNAALLQ